MSNSNPSNLRFGIFGAGSIGCYVGAKLIHGGVPVTLLGRESLGREIHEHGLHVSDLTGAEFHLRPDQIDYATDPAALQDCDVVLVTVKSRDSEDAGRVLGKLLRPNASIVSFQNGVRNAEILGAAAASVNANPPQVLAGMVPYNVLRSDGARFHCGTSGELMIAAAEPTQRIADVLRSVGLPTKIHDDLIGVLWGKLIFNLNNAVNALAGVPLREELSQRGYRKIMAATIKEALSVMEASGVTPLSVGRMIPWLAPKVLALPDWLFFRVAASMVKIDPEARSSMWEDLQRGRPTEIDYITGEIVRLADEHDLPAPVARRTVELIRAAEQGGGSPGLSAQDLGRELAVKI